MHLTQQLWKGNAPYATSLVAAWVSLLNTAKVSITLTVVTSVSYIFLQSTSWWTIDELSMKSVPWVLQWKWASKVTRHWNCCNLKMLELPNWWSQPERSVTKELPAPQEEPKSREPKVPTGSKDHQVEVDEVKGSEV